MYTFLAGFLEGGKTVSAREVAAVGGPREITMWGRWPASIFDFYFLSSAAKSTAAILVGAGMRSIVGIANP